MKKRVLGALALMIALSMLCLCSCDMISDSSLIGELLGNANSGVDDPETNEIDQDIFDVIQGVIPDDDEHYSQSITVAPDWDTYYSEYVTVLPDIIYPDQWETEYVCQAHEFGEWTLEAQASCIESGKRYRDCRLCGELEAEIVPASGHNYQDEVCQKCGRKYYSEGLKFVPDENGYVLQGIGTCSDLEINVPPTYNGQPVHTVGAQAFMDCQATIIRLPEGVEILQNEALRNCFSLELLELPSSLTYIDEWAFFCLGSLEKITVAEPNPQYRAYEGCLIDIQSGTLMLGCKNSIIPNDGSVKIIGSYAFSGCNELESISIPEGVTTIGDSAFYCCAGLKSIVIPPTVTEIGYNCFNSCGLEYAVLPEGLRKIEDNTFNYCSELKEVYIPESVESIGIYAFNNCVSLKLITFGGTQTQWNNMVRTPNWDIESGDYKIVFVTEEVTLE